MWARQAVVELEELDGGAGGRAVVVTEIRGNARGVEVPRDLEHDAHINLLLVGI